MANTIEEKHNEIWELIQASKVGMLTTIDGNTLRARPMYVVQKAYEGDLWFFTEKSSAKVYEALRNRRVNLTFTNVEEDIFLSLSGEASIDNDPERIEALWSKAVDLWFPGGKNNGDITLLKVDVTEGESWTINESGLKRIYEMAKAAITSGTPDLGTNEKFKQ